MYKIIRNRSNGWHESLLQSSLSELLMSTDVSTLLDNDNVPPPPLAPACSGERSVLLPTPEAPRPGLRATEEAVGCGEIGSPVGERRGKYAEICLIGRIGPGQTSMAMCSWMEMVSFFPLRTVIELIG